MKVNTLRQLIDANPFKPFSINLADGRELPVPHRDFISISPSTRMLTVWDENDAADLVDLVLVVGFHVKGQKNGHTKRSK